jgi:hypothetical protein
VREASRARKAEERARRHSQLQNIAEIVGEVGDVAMRGMQGATALLQFAFPMAQERLKAALVAHPDLVHCRTLTELTLTQVSSEMSLDDIRYALDTAFGELRGQVAHG